MHSDCHKVIIAMSLLTLPARAATPTFTPASLTGCFEVSYRFMEDGTHDYGPTTALERIDPADDGKGGIRIAHFQVDGTAKVAHFDERWQQNADGAWHQTVTGPADEPQYECTAQALFSQWVCSTPGTPKPRRDMGRSDYDVLDRDSAVQITASGWIQAERNVKRKADGTAVANEVGWVEYRRVADVRCDVTLQPRSYGE